MTNILEVKLK